MPRSPAAGPAMTRSGSCANGWPTCWPSPEGAPTLWRTTRPCARSSRRRGRRRRGPPPTQDRRAALGGRRPRARQAPASTPALDRLGQDGDPIERAQLYQEIGRLAFRAGDNAGAIAWAERALAEAARADAAGFRRRAGRERARPRCRPTTRWAWRSRGQASPGRRSTGSSRASRSPRVTICCRRLAAATPTSACSRARSIRRAASRPACAASRSPGRSAISRFQSRLHANLAVAYCALTDRCEAEGIEAAETAIDLDRRLGLIDHLAVPLIVLGQIRQCHGDHGPALASYQEALALAEQAGEPQLLFPCYDGLATLYLDAGDRCEGRALPGEGPGRLRTGRHRARRAPGPAVSLLTGRDGGFT